MQIKLIRLLSLSLAISSLAVAAHAESLNLDLGPTGHQILDIILPF
jgi:hypothetical protein